MKSPEQLVVDQLLAAVSQATDTAAINGGVFMTFTTPHGRIPFPNGGGYQATEHLTITNNLEHNLTQVFERILTRWVPMGYWYFDRDQTMIAPVWPFDSDDLWDIVNQTFQRLPSKPLPEC